MFRAEWEEAHKASPHRFEEHILRTPEGFRWVFVSGIVVFFFFFFLEHLFHFDLMPTANHVRDFSLGLLYKAQSDFFLESY